jgi:uncharacterized tellurite resistance protein B-like protein
MSIMREVEVIQAACCVAAVDGQIADIERKIIQVLADDVGVGLMSLQAMLDRAENDKDFYEEQFHILKESPLETIRLLLAIALADDDLQDGECEMIKAFSSRLGLVDEQFDKLIDEAENYLRHSRPAAADCSRRAPQAPRFHRQ